MSRRSVEASGDIEGQSFWPHARGQVGHYGVSSWAGPTNLSASLAWSWHHPEGRFHTTVLGGSVVDEQKNVYLVSEDGIRKFSRDGQELWHYSPGESVVACPSLMAGSLFGSTILGHAFALDILTGKPRWSRRLAANMGMDTSYVEAHDGVVVLGTVKGQDPIMIGGNLHVLGLNSTDGSTLWDYEPDRVVWNVMGVFPGDGSVVFMDFTGGVYRLGLHEGTLLWHTPPPADSTNSFSDGGVLLSQNGVAFSCSNTGTDTGFDGTRGALRAYSIDDGRLLWNQTLPYACNSWPAISADGRLVVVPVGGFPGSLTSHPSGVLAFDAATGEQLWRFEAPPWFGPAAGDAEGEAIRRSLKHRHACVPASWSSPTFAADGTVYVGHESGLLYALRDADGDGVVGGNEEVSSFDTRAGFLHSGTSFAPGMMAIASCDSLFVFNT